MVVVTLVSVVVVAVAVVAVVVDAVVTRVSSGSCVFAFELSLHHIPLRRFLCWLNVDRFNGWKLQFNFFRICYELKF